MMQDAERRVQESTLVFRLLFLVIDSVDQRANDFIQQGQAMLEYLWLEQASVHLPLLASCILPLAPC
jgi:hypothetical protein